MPESLFETEIRNTDFYKSLEKESGNLSWERGAELWIDLDRAKISGAITQMRAAFKEAGIDEQQLQTHYANHQLLNTFIIKTGTANDPEQVAKYTKALQSVYDQSPDWLPRVGSAQTADRKPNLEEAIAAELERGESADTIAEKVRQIIARAAAQKRHHG